MYMVQNSPKYDNIICEQPLTIEDIYDTENVQMYSEKRNLTCDKKTFMDNLRQKYEN